MYPSKPNTNADMSARDSDTSKFTTPYPTSSEKQEAPSQFGQQSSNPSAPLLPSSPYNPAAPNMEPPPYSSVVNQDSSDWKNRSSSFSAGNNLRPYPPAAPHITGSRSTSGLDNQAPYPSGPGPASQAPYPTGGYSSYGPPAQAPYPSGPGVGSGITSQPPYSTGSGYIPGPASQAPYPVGAMPMPGPVDANRQIGFTAPITIEPKATSPVYQTGGYGQAPNMMQPGVNQQGLIYPMSSGENNQYVQSQYVPNQYGQQQQQPQTVYVVQKAPEQSDSTDDCCLLACCLASCYCLCECIKICASDS